MKISTLNSWRLTAACSLTMALAPVALAQPATDPIPSLQPIADPMSYRFMLVHNVSPAWIASRIDPAHNRGPAVPPDIEHAYNDNFSPATFKNLPRQANGSALPEGILSIVAVHPQTGAGVLAYGTDAGMERLRKLLDSLDKPVQFVEIDSKIIEVDPEYLAGFGIDFHSSSGPFSVSTTGLNLAMTAGGVSVGYSPNHWQAQLETLLAAHKAKVLIDSQMATANNRTVDANSSYSCVEPDAQQGYPGYVTVNDALAMTPTVNNDNTITLVLKVKHTRQFFEDATGPSVLNSSEMTTTANIKDGDTIALGGLRDGTNVASNNIPATELPAGAPNMGAHRPGERDLLVFVSVHLVKPAQ